MESRVEPKTDKGAVRGNRWSLPFQCHGVHQLDYQSHVPLARTNLDIVLTAVRKRKPSIDLHGPVVLNTHKLSNYTRSFFWVWSQIPNQWMGCLRHDNKESGLCALSTTHIQLEGIGTRNLFRVSSLVLILAHKARQVRIGPWWPQPHGVSCC